MSALARLRRSLLPAPDAARLYMSLPENPMVITNVLCFDTKLDHAALVKLLEARLASYPQFRARVSTWPFGLGPARWREVAGFDFAAHVSRLELPGSNEPAALEAAVSRAMSAPLDPRRPLWQMHHLENSAGPSTLVVRLHHCLGDGAALVSLLRALSDERQAPPAEPAPKPEGQHQRHSLGSLLRAAARAARWLLAAPEPASALRGPLGGHKRVVFSQAFPLSALLEGSRARGTKLTALLLAATAGALSRWHSTPHPRALKSLPSAPAELRALLPVSLRSGGGARASNVFASVFVRLPLDAPAQDLRLERVGAELARVAKDETPFVWAKLVKLAGIALPALTRLFVRSLSRRSSLVISNVTGPRETLRLGGARLRELLVSAPAPGDIALSITLVSYAGRVRVSVACDGDVVRDPHALLGLLEEELSAASSPQRPRALQRPIRTPDS